MQGTGSWMRDHVSSALGSATLDTDSHIMKAQVVRDLRLCSFVQRSWLLTKFDCWMHCDVDWLIQDLLGMGAV